MKRETTIRIARALWRVGFAAGAIGGAPCMLLSALGRGRGAVALACASLSLAGCAAAILAAILAPDPLDPRS